MNITLGLVTHDSVYERTPAKKFYYKTIPHTICLEDTHLGWAPDVTAVLPVLEFLAITMDQLKIAHIGGFMQLG